MWCWLIGHKWGKTGPWYPWPGGPEGWETRNVQCPRWGCGRILYRQVRDAMHKLILF